MLFKGKKYFLDTVAKCCPDTEVLYDHNNIVIVKVNSYSDCNEIFYDDTIDWCIAGSRNQWESYVGKPTQSQYFIIDFNDIKSRDKHKYNYSLIGFTLENEKLMAAHARNDKNLLDSNEKAYVGYHPFEQILLDKGIYDFVIKNKMKGGPTDDERAKSNGMWLVWLLIGLILLAMCSLLFKCS